MVERWRGRISTGMQVRGSDGEKLGKVVECQGGGFVVEKGFLFPKDIVVPYDRVSEVRGNEISISLARADLGDGASSAIEKPMDEVTRLARSAKESVKEIVKETVKDAPTGAPRAALDQFGQAGEIRMELVEEELVAKKQVEKVGEVRVRKEVITEERQITVPVMREVVRVERVPVSHEVRAGTAVFEKEAYDFPISEERVIVEKRPMVREEIRVEKEIQQGEETAGATVRREHAEVETMGRVRRTEVPVNDTTALRPTGTGGAKR